MRHIFATNDNVKLNGITVVPESWLGAAIEAFNTCDEVCLDLETTGLSVYKDKILLVSLYNPKYDWVLVVDTQSIPITFLNGINWKKITMVAHNTQFDAKFLLYNGVDIHNVYCTMVAEAKLMQGSPYSVSLVNTLERRKIPVPLAMDKDIRMKFVSGEDIDPEDAIRYSASDVLVLPTLKELQAKNIADFNLGYFINSIHNPLSLVLAKISLEGFVFNSKKWLDKAEEVSEVCNNHIKYLNARVMPLVDWMSINSDIAKAKESKDKAIIRLTNRIDKQTKLISHYEEKNKQHLKVYTNAVASLYKAEEELKEQEAITFDLKVGINWSSSKQVLETFMQLGMKPLPMSKSATTNKMQPSVSHAARDAWLLENTDHMLTPIMEVYHELKNRLHLVKSFGEAWVEKYVNPVTGRVHTSFRQNAATGRLTSGNADEGLFNSQQIPGNNDYRHCFGTDEGYSVATIDYSGAELCFMAVTAEDDRLIELSKLDMHSYFANKGWEAIYNSRGWEWTPKEIISKDSNKHRRTGYKPMMFGVVYGLKAKKAAETLNVTTSEGQIAINTIIKEIPKTIKMVEEASDFAITNGYVIHNSRTNSRRWFMDAYASKLSGKEMPFMIRSGIESTARNTRIQGSQADMIMEAIVTINRWLNIYKIDAMIIGTVHDEIIFKFKEEGVLCLEK